MSKTNSIKENRVSLIIHSHLNDAEIEFQSTDPETRQRASFRLHFVKLLLAKFDSNELISKDDADQTWERVVAVRTEKATGL